jgi:hypothetical protein
MLVNRAWNVASRQSVANGVTAHPDLDHGGSVAHPEIHWGLVSNT